LEKATEMVGKNLQSGSVVVFESTVYPGATEDICLPILEKESKLKAGQDFKIGYSPERVNPGDKEHAINNIIKVVSGMDEESTKLIVEVYNSITKIFQASSIKVAEAAKVIENTQRDLNIAFVNELAVLFNKLGISIYDVLEAAGTKWNFLPFKPGLVGGHCIGVDPYYLTYKAKEIGYNPEVILAGRGINDSMHKFIARQIIKEIVRNDKDVSNLKFVIFGITFKENVSDIRNSKVAELCQELIEFGIDPKIYDPLANLDDVKTEYGLDLCPVGELPKADVLIVSVAHDIFKNMDYSSLFTYTKGKGSLVADIKHIYNTKKVKEIGLNYWSL
jgi:UDP-N-acetyl-D-glucosamine/UDP-N-acetyl-D-galactosamine dehydrogenase